jgi:hypothetical protein
MKYKITLIQNGHNYGTPYVSVHVADEGELSAKLASLAALSAVEEIHVVADQHRDSANPCSWRFGMSGGMG